MKKSYLIISLVCVLIISAVVFINFNTSNHFMPSGDLAYRYEKIDDIIRDSSVIVTGKAVSNNSEFEYGGVTFATTEYKIDKVIRGNDIPDTVKVLQTKMDIDPYIKKNEQKLLFLHKYEGPVAKDVFVITGLYLGQYSIIDDNVIPIANTNFLDRKGKTKLNDYISLSNEVQFVPKEKKRNLTTEEINRENEINNKDLEKVKKEAQDSYNKKKDNSLKK